jgi:hypothetical protein
MRTLEDKFEAYHRANPWLYERLVNLAVGLKSQGHKRCSIKMLWEVVRFEKLKSGLHTMPTNSYHSRYARLIMATRGQYLGEGFFKLRQTTARGDKKPRLV